MRETTILFIKGFIIGIGKVVPGVSGSVLAILLGVYERGVYALSHFRDHIKENFLFLLKTGLGILCAIALGSTVILWMLDQYYFSIMLLFCFLIVGTIPSIRKKASLRNVKGLSYFFLSFLIGMTFSLYQGSSTNAVNPSFLFLFLTGFIEAATMIIPGISGTAILMILGVYPLVLETFSHLFHPAYLTENIGILFPFAIGLLCATICVTKVLAYFLERHEKESYSAILGFSLSSLFLLVQNMFEKGTPTFSFGLLFLCTICLIISYRFSLKESF